MSYIPAGGFNNQRQSLERLVQLALLLRGGEPLLEPLPETSSLGLALPPVHIDVKHNSADGWHPLESVLQVKLWQERQHAAHEAAGLSSTRANGTLDAVGVRRIPAQTIQTVLHAEPQFSFDQWRDAGFPAAGVVKGLFAGGRVWSDGREGKQVREITGQGIVPAEQVLTVESGMLDESGCSPETPLVLGLVGMNRFWRMSAEVRRAAAQYVRIAEPLLNIAKTVVQEELDGRGGFSCIHWRRGDKLVVSPGEYNFAAEDVVPLIEQVPGWSNDEPIYIATDDMSAESLGGFVRAWGGRVVLWPLVSQHVPPGTIPTLPDGSPWNDMIGVIEVEMCTSARLFFGSSSTMTASILNQRHNTTGITEWEVDWTKNFRLTRMVREARAAEQQV